MTNTDDSDVLRTAVDNIRDHDVYGHDGVLPALAATALGGVPK